ncbi:MAG: hypothetical protein ACKVKF_11705 [Rhodobacterales bacterium]
MQTNIHLDTNRIATARWLVTHPQDNDLDPVLMADSFAMLVEARGGRINFQTIGRQRHLIGPLPVCARFVLYRARLHAVPVVPLTANAILAATRDALPATLRAIARHRARSAAVANTDIHPDCAG